MNLQEVWKVARDRMAPKCRACPDCNGVACKGEIPGTGGIGSGSSFTVCREYLKQVKVLMDVVYEPKEIDTSIELFGKEFDLPVFMAPIGGMKFNYNGYLTDDQFADYTVNGLVEAGSLSFTPDGANIDNFTTPLKYVKELGGLAVPTIKPWDFEGIQKRIRYTEEANAIALACDIDSCGNLNLIKQGFPVYPMSLEKMKQIINETSLPFIIKGIMTADAAVRCADAGCYGIVVSTHGGRVIEDSPATMQMLPEIREAVGDRIKIFVDGGIRSGLDVFKCLALGADAVLIGRTYAIAAHGGGKEAVIEYTEKLKKELESIMMMTGCTSLEDIDITKIRNY